MENNGEIPFKNTALETLSDFTAMQIQVLELKKHINLVLDGLISDLERMEIEALKP